MSHLLECLKLKSLTESNFGKGLKQLEHSYTAGRNVEEFLKKLQTQAIWPSHPISRYLFKTNESNAYVHAYPLKLYL